jgi:hypothetical protein
VIVRIISSFALVALSVVMGTSFAKDPEPRAGLVEPFDQVEGWQPGRDPDRPDPAFGPRELKCEEGRLIIDTPLGTLAQISPDYFTRRGIRPHPNPVWLSKRYGEVDIDRYPYLVARMPRSQCFTLLRVNGPRYEGPSYHRLARSGSPRCRAAGKAADRAADSDR